MRVILLSGLAALLATPLAAQTQSFCTATAGVPPVIRAEGRTELLGDLLLTCPALSSPMTVDVYVQLNTPLTSPPRGTGTDAIVVIEPVPLVPGVNLFRGVRYSDNAVKFPGVSLPASGTTMALRVSNLRTDATSVVRGDMGFPGQVIASLVVTPSTALSISNAQQVVGYVQPAYRAGLRTAADQPFTPVIVNGGALNSGLLAGSGAGATPQFLLKFNESLQSSFKPRSRVAAGNPPPAQTFASFNTETGFYDPALPAAGEWNVTGLAGSGTRLMATFSGIAPGVSVFVSATPWPSASTQGASSLRLTTADANGAGNYNPAAATMTTTVGGVNVPIAQVPIVNGTGTAVWEVVDAAAASAGIMETQSFAVFLAYPAGTTAAQPGTVTASLAPLAPAGTSVIPRFSPGSSFVIAVPPNTPAGDLVPSITLTNNDIGAGGTINGTASVTNQGPGLTLGPSRLRMQVYSGGTTVGLPFDCQMNDSLLAGWTSNGEVASMIMPCSWALVAPAIPGTYSVRATADANGAIAETNENNNTRSISITVAPCQWILQNATVVVPATTGVSSIPIKTSPGCIPTLTQPAQTWLTADYQAYYGLSISYQANPGSVRSTTFTVGGQTVTVWQTSAACTYSISPTSLLLSSQGQTKSLQVNTGAGCPWAPSLSTWPPQSWDWLTTATVANAGPGAIGPGRIDVTSARNTGDARQANVIVAGNWIWVQQLRGNETTPPFGYWDTPAEGATGLTGAIPVSGWALDDTYVGKVQIWRDPVAGEPSQLIYIGDATFVNGARSDIAGLYPLMPFNTRGGWGYMMLTYGLPTSGNGTFRLHAFAIDDAGNSTPLGTKTITCSNATSTRPFGTIDTPAPGQTISGTSFRNWAWALTPMPHAIPTDASTLAVFIDGQRQSVRPEYNIFRSDIASLFPGYANRNGAVGRYIFDTTTLANGLHTIAWSVRDSAGDVDGIGSRYFEVNNAPQFRVTAEEPKPAFRASATSREDVWVRTGYDTEAPLRRAAEWVEVAQADRIELHLPAGIERGCVVADGHCTELPAGSKLEDGVFYWQMGPAFLGDFELRFSGSQDVTARFRIR